MTIEERFERIEHVTAGLAEQHRRDYEESRQLWRDTQRQINELGAKISEVDERLGKRIEQLAEESRAADKRLEERIEGLTVRIEKLVSGVGEFLTMGKRPS